MGAVVEARGQGEKRIGEKGEKGTKEMRGEKKRKKKEEGKRIMG